MHRTTWDELLAHQSTAASTLDLLRRLPDDGVDAPSAVSTPVRDEMVAIALQEATRLRDALPRQTVKLPLNTTTLGELADRPKPTYVPGTPVTRRLRGGRLVRSDGKFSLATSRSEPLLLPLRSGGSSEDGDELDRMLQARHSSDAEPTKSPTTTPVPTPAAASSPLPLSLDEQRLQLENRLLHVTRKLCRKYAKQLDRSGSGSATAATAASPAKLRERADKWSHGDELSDAERYRLCAAGRFATQTTMDFYERPVEPRDAENDRHRRPTQHTKYGDSLARSKHSLRAPF